MEYNKPLPALPPALPPGFALAEPELPPWPGYPTVSPESSSDASSPSGQMHPEETNDIADQIPDTPADIGRAGDRVPDSPAGIKELMWRPAFDGRAVTLEGLDAWARHIMAHDPELTRQRYRDLPPDERLKYALNRTYGTGAWRMIPIVDDQAQRSNRLHDLQGSELGQTHLGTEQANQPPVFFIDYMPPLHNT